MSQLLVLRRQCRSDDLDHHKSRIETAFLYEEGRQAGQVRIDQEGDAAFGHRTDLGNGQGQVISGEGNRFRVKISARQHRVVEHERIVGHGARFDP